MPRAKNKDELLTFAAKNYSQLMDMISQMTENR